MDLSTYSASNSSSTNEQSCQSWWDFSCITWWGIVGPLVVFFFLILTLVLTCQCFLKTYRNCRNGREVRQRIRRQIHANAVSTVSEVVRNDSYANEGLDLPPAYSSANFNRDLFRIESTEDSRRASRTSATEKLPSYEELTKPSADSQIEVHTTIFSENEITQPSRSFQPSQDSSSSDGQASDDASTTDDDGPDPPPYQLNV